MIVLDASALVDWLTGARAAPIVAERISSSRRRHVLDLTLLEVASALRREVRLNRLVEPRARAMLMAASGLSKRVHESAEFLPRIWELRDISSVHDAAYLALAEALGAPLLTSDLRLARATGHRAEIVDLSS